MAAAPRTRESDDAYLAAHPEAAALVQYLTTRLVIERPDDPVAFARECVCAGDATALQRRMSQAASALLFREEGYTLEEVAKHNTPQDAWIAVRGKVYVVTHFFEEHPGGARPLEMGIGQDATETFEGIHAHVNPDKRLEHFYIGPLVDKVDEVAAPAQSVATRGYTLAEIAAHNTLDDAWVAVRGQVYDVTKFLHEHPGGATALWRGCGRDATKMFDKIHPHVQPQELLKDAYLGPLIDGAPDESKGSDIDESKRPTNAVLSPTEWKPFKLLSKEKVSAMSYRFTFELPPGKILGLVTGQAVMVQMTHNGEQRTSAYTPTSLVHQEGTFELVIKVYPKGAVSAAMGRLTPGESALFKGPVGSLRYADGELQFKPQGPKHKVTRFLLLAGGSGITPMLQLIRRVVMEGSDVEVTLLDSNHQPDMIILRPLLDELAHSNSNITVHYFVSEGAASAHDPAGDLWSGRIDKAALVELGYAPSATTFALLCGPHGFTAALSAGVEAIGYAKDHVYVY